MAKIRLKKTNFMKQILVYSLVSFFAYSCSLKSGAMDDNSNKVDSLNLPKDYISKDNRTTIKFYPNGNIKKIEIISDIFEAPSDYDSNIIETAYVMQMIDYNENLEVNRAILNCNRDANFEYRIGDSIEKFSVDCFNCD